DGRHQPDGDSRRPGRDGTPCHGGGRHHNAGRDRRPRRARRRFGRRHGDLYGETEGSRVAGTSSYFLSVVKYATSASTSSLSSEYCFMTGLRVAPVFVVIALASVIHARM